MTTTVNSSIYIPLLNGNQSVELDIHSLPADVSDVIDFLTLEYAHPQIWIYIALQYYRHDDTTSFLTICLQLASAEAQEAYSAAQYKPYKIRVFVLLAMYYATIGEYKTANDYVVLASNLDVKNTSIWLCKAYIQFNQTNNIPQTTKQLEVAAQCDSGVKAGEKNVLVVLFRAIMYYYDKNYKKSLEAYYQVLLLNPAIAASVRHGIAHCYIQLNMADKAVAVFDRILELGGNDIHAVIGSTVLQQKDQAQQVGQKLLGIFADHASDVYVSIYVVKYLFLAGQYDTVDKLCKKLLTTNITNYRVKSELNYYIGQAAHATGNDIIAYNYYNTAYDLHKTNNALLFHLAQLCTKQTNYNKSNEYLLQITLPAAQSSYLYNYLYAYNYFKLNKYSQSYTHCHLIADTVKTHRIEFLILYLFVSTFTNLSTAEKVAIDVQQYYTRHNMELPAPISSNIAVVLYKLDKYEQAIHQYAQALQLPKLESVDDIASVTIDIVADNVTIAYDFCLCIEQYAISNDKPALLRYVESIYKEIVNKFDTYNSAYLKLGRLYEHYVRHKLFDCQPAQILEQYNKSFSVQPNDVTSLICIGNYYMSVREFDNALKRFESLKSKSGKLGDVYSALQYCNIYLSIIHKQLVKYTVQKKDVRIADDQKLTDCVQKLDKYYNLVLENDGQNMYAAVGLSITLALQGHYDEAKNILLEVKTQPQCADLLTVYLTLGHIYYNTQSYNIAINYYIHIHDVMYVQRNDKLVKQQNFSMSEVTVVLYISNCYFQLNQLDSAIQYIEQALKSHADNSQLLYNLSLIYEQKSIVLLQRIATEHVSYGDIERAIEQLKQSESIFASLNTCANKQIQEKAKVHHQFVAQSLQKADPLVQHAQQAYQQQLQAEQEAQVLRQEQEAKLRVDEEAKAQVLAEQRQKMEAEAAAKKRELDAMRSEWNTMAALAAASSKKKKGDDGSDGDEGTTVVAGGVEQPVSQKKRRKTGESTKKRRSKKRGDDSDDEQQSVGSADQAGADTVDIAAAPSVLQPSPDPVSGAEDDGNVVEEPAADVPEVSKPKRGRLQRHTDAADVVDIDVGAASSTKSKSKRRKIEASDDEDDTADAATNGADDTGGADSSNVADDTAAMETES